MVPKVFISQMVIVSKLLVTKVQSEIEGSAMGCPSLNLTQGCRATFVKGSDSNLGDFNEVGSIIKTWLFGTLDAYRYVLCQADGHYNATTYCLFEDYLTRCDTSDYKSVSHLIMNPNRSIILTGRVLRFYCEPGFALEGPSSIYCKTNNTWNDRRLPHCTGCPYPQHLVNGYYTDNNDEIYVTGGKPVNEIITAHCNQNFILQGGSNTTCLTDGVWSHGGQKCLAATCDPPTNLISNGFFTFIDGSNTSSRNIKLGDKLILVCKKGFSSADYNFVICQKGGKWSDLTGNGCRIANSTNPDKGQDAKRTGQSKQTVMYAVVGAVLGFVCIILFLTGIKIFIMFRRREEKTQNSNYDSLRHDDRTSAVNDHYDELQTALPETDTVYAIS